MLMFNKAPYTSNEEKYVKDAIKSRKLSGDGKYTKLCHRWFEEKLHKKCLLTPNCTQALEMAALLIDIQPGDEVIVPSYTFVSSANAFVLRGAKIVFVDIRPDTMNIDEGLIEDAITERTKVIVPVHYAGVACEMDTIMAIAHRHDLYVVEDAAQAMMSTYKGKALGTIGHFGCYSFHETKNYTSGGEGGLLIINDTKFIQRSEIIREKGTDRSLFFQGLVDKYSWVDLGSSYLPSDLQAAYLYGQLEMAEEINKYRKKVWDIYDLHLSNLDFIETPNIPSYANHNAHMYYIKVDNLSTRGNLIEYLKSKNIMSVFHYIPLHSANGGGKFSRFSGIDRYTTIESERLLRLPIYYGIKDHEIMSVIENVICFFESLSRN